MSGPEPLAALAACASSLGYIGPGAGLEFVTYAVSLLAMAGVALSAVLLWPVYTLLRWLRGPRPPAPPVVPASANDTAPPLGAGGTATGKEGTSIPTA
jgi:hypothetical protein